MDSRQVPPGTVQLSRVSTAGGVVLQPKPTNDPDDPLNWSTWRKSVNYSIVLLYVLFTFAMLDISTVSYGDLVQDIGANFQVITVVTALNYAGLAVGGIAFIPLVYRYGRRPVYLVSVVIQLVSAIWLARVRSNGEFIAVNFIMGLGGAISETVVQITIADLFFVHQYATMNGIFLFAQGVGAYLGPVAAGYIVTLQGWRWIWWWCVIFLAMTLLLVLFMFEESTFILAIDGETSPPAPLDEESVASAPESQNVGGKALEPLRLSQTTSHVVVNPHARAKPRRARLSLITNTGAPIAHHFLSPFMILFNFPAVAYTAITYGSVMAWFSALITVASTSLIYPPYNFSPDAIGLFNLAPFAGQLIGTLIIAPISDIWIVRLAKRNGGIYEPEMRLWLALIAPFLVSGGILAFGIGIAHDAPWIVLAFGVGVFAAGFSVALDISLAYLTDCYQNIIGDALVAVVFVRNTLALIVSFCLSPWQAGMGIQNMFILIGVLSFVLLLIPIPLILWGKKARMMTADKYYSYSLRQPTHRPL